MFALRLLATLVFVWVGRQISLSFERRAAKEEVDYPFLEASLKWMYTFVTLRPLIALTATAVEAAKAGLWRRMKDWLIGLWGPNPFPIVHPPSKLPHL